MNKKKYTFYTVEEKLEYIKLVLEGEYNQAEIARKNNMSKELSGIYQGVKLASESLKKAKLHLVDSKSVSFGQLYLVK